MNTKYYTVDEASVKIGVHTKTVRRYIYSGKIKALKIGGQWRIEEEDLNEYLSTGSCKVECDDGNNDNVSRDDFCVFMDGELFDSNENFQICSIVDYFVEPESKLKLISTDLMQLVSTHDSSGSSKFNYAYDKEQRKARFVLWGSPKFMEIVMGVLKSYD
ncbi:MAG: helix-turn-helix domain-containing protein [Acidaminobacteraceae bacterium]